MSADRIRLRIPAAVWVFPLVAAGSGTTSHAQPQNLHVMRVHQNVNFLTAGGVTTRRVVRSSR